MAQTGWRWPFGWVCMLWLGGLLGPALAGWAVARAEAPPAPAADEAHAERADIRLNNRLVLTLRGPLGGDSPAQRAEAAQLALQAALAAQSQSQSQGPAGAGAAELAVNVQPVGSAVRVEVGGQPVFFITAADVGASAQPGLLEPAAHKVRARLALALREAREARDPRALLRATLLALGFSAAALLAAWGLRGAGRRASRALEAWSAQVRARPRGTSVAALGLRFVPGLAGALLVLLRLALALALLELWAAQVLQLYAWTRPWGEAASAWAQALLGQFALGAAQAVPGLLTAALILLAARLINRGLAALVDEVERGELSLRWLHPDTAGATRRIASLLVWLFALALAYPYLPGAQSESLKGVTVLAGVMLSLGASGVVGQAMAGLTLTYSRALRPGEYVRVGDAEGTVTAVGLFVTRLQTGLGEEVCLPNAQVMGQAIRNFSRGVPDGRFVVQAAVTIGYATPWRQVHAMLLEAARRTAGVAPEPPPRVLQTALSDFYVEYRLVAHADRSAPQRRAEAISALNGHIQDVFNQNGVQIMSPHYRGDPPEPQVVPPGAWAPVQGEPLRPPPGAA